MGDAGTSDDEMYSPMQDYWPTSPDQQKSTMLEGESDEGELYIDEEYVEKEEVEPFPTLPECPEFSDTESEGSGYSSKVDLKTEPTDDYPEFPDNTDNESKSSGYGSRISIKAEPKDEEMPELQLVTLPDEQPRANDQGTQTLELVTTEEEVDTDHQMIEMNPRIMTPVVDNSVEGLGSTRYLGDYYDPEEYYILHSGLENMEKITRTGYTYKAYVCADKKCRKTFSNITQAVKHLEVHGTCVRCNLKCKFLDYEQHMYSCTCSDDVNLFQWQTNPYMCNQNRRMHEVMRTPIQLLKKRNARQKRRDSKYSCDNCYHSYGNPRRLADHKATKCKATIKEQEVQKKHKQRTTNQGNVWKLK